MKIKYKNEFFVGIKNHNNNINIIINVSYTREQILNDKLYTNCLRNFAKQSFGSTASRLQMSIEQY